MYTKQVSKHPKALVEVAITVPWADLEGKYNETLQRLSQEVEIPGFRKGAAPLEMVEPKISAQVIQEMLKTVMPDTLMQALQGENIVPIDYPQYQVISFAKGTELKFNARVTERPVIKVGDYKSIKIAKPAPKQITDEEINKVVEDLFKRWKLRNPQGSQPANPQGDQTSASGSMSFNAQSPAAPSETPDDNFAKAIGAQGLDDLKQKIRTDMENEAKFNSDMDHEEAILSQVEKMTTVDIPDMLVEDEMNRMLVNLQRRVTDTGMLLDDYLKQQKKTLDDYKREWRPQAERNVRMELGLSEIARSENVVISDEELQAEIDKIQDARLKQQFASQEPRMHLRHAMRQTKTLQLLKTLVG